MRFVSSMEQAHAAVRVAGARRTSRPHLEGPPERSASFGEDALLAPALAPAAAGPAPDGADGEARIAGQVPGDFLPAEIESGGAGQGSAAATPVIAETNGNDSFAAAQSIDRAVLAVAGNAELPDDAMPSVTIAGSIATVDDRDFFSITLNAGDMLILDVDGTEPSQLDSVVRFYDASFNEVAANDDWVTVDPGTNPARSHNSDPQIRFWASKAGTYYFSIGSYENWSSGAYELHVSVAPAATHDWLVAQVDQLIMGPKWDRLDLSFGFPTLAGDYPANPREAREGFAAFNELQRASTRDMLGMFADVSALTFTENVQAPGWATLRYAMSTLPGSAWAYYPWNSGGEYQAYNSAGSAWFNPSPWNSGPDHNYNQPLRGNFGWRGILHETGHALGLKHSHDGPPVSAEYDSHEFTVMAYRSFVGQQYGGGYSNERWGYPQTPMMLDIAALQKLYGPNFAINAGDTVYSWGPGAGETFVNGVGQGQVGDGSAEANRILITVWDGGGADTYDLSAFASDVVIDLGPGEWTITSTVQLAYLGDGHHARGNIGNALMFEGDPRSLIENGIGGSGNDRITGNQAANRLEGGAGADILIGGLGADILVGGLGSDIFIYRSIAESAGAAIDLILAFQSGLDLIDLLAVSPLGLSWSETTDASSGALYSLVAVTTGSGDMSIRVEGAVKSSDFRIDGGRTYQGTAGADDLSGGGSHDRIDGGAGADRMRGFHGDDTYEVDDAGDVVVELANQGSDIVRSTVSWALAAGSEVETIVAADPASTTPLELTGNEFAQKIIGNAGDNLLDGRGGADVLQGGAGNDVYRVDAGDAVLEAAGGGRDVVLASESWSLAAAAEVEILSAVDAAGTAALDLTGNGFAQTISGNAGPNVLRGGGGADTLRGFAGNDSYFIDSNDDVVEEQAGGGFDRLSVDAAMGAFTLAVGVEIEILAADDPLSETALDLTGNAFAQRIVGNAGENRLTGGGGADTLVGGNGNDLYWVDADDVIVELAGQGFDYVLATENYALGAGVAVEFMSVVAGTQDMNLTGNELAQNLWGNQGANVLRGGGGADILHGFGGDDTYYIDGGDTFYENPGEGYDRVYTSVSLSLFFGDEVEFLSVEDVSGTAAINLTGSYYAQHIIGNAGANVLDGRDGADRLEGGLGDDVYVVGAGDTIVENPNEGTDEVRTSLATYSLLGTNVENLTGSLDAGHDFRGSAGNNVIRGGSLRDFIRLQDGGNDIAVTGEGSDTVYFGGAFDALDTVDTGGGADAIILQGDYAAGITLGSGSASNISNVESISLAPGHFADWGDTANASYSYNLTAIDANVPGGGILRINGHHLRSGENLTFDGSLERDGRFFVFGGLGIDHLTGGDGNDIFVFGHDGRFGQTDVLHGGPGYDSIYLRGDYDLDFTQNGFGIFTGVESITLGWASDSQFVVGGDGEFDYDIVWKDSMIETGVRITVNGSGLAAGETMAFDGSDETGGHFRLWGGAAADTLAGGGGSDLIFGGLGADLLRGNGGGDVFRYHEAAESVSGGQDTIQGFTHLVDLIDLAIIDANGNEAGDQAFRFIEDRSFSGSGPSSAGELRAFRTDALTNSWQIEGDVDGNGSVDFKLTVTVELFQPLTAGDFIL